MSGSQQAIYAYGQLPSSEPAYDLPYALSLYYGTVNQRITRAATAGASRQKFTLSMWIKRGLMSASLQLLSWVGNTGNDVDTISFAATASALVYQCTVGGVISGKYTGPVLLDDSGWYHICLQVDTTQATASNRAKLFINGLQVNLTANTAFALNANTNYGRAVNHQYGMTTVTGQSVVAYDGLIGELIYLDGLIANADDFGRYINSASAWVPRAYPGAFPGESYYLNFANISSLTIFTQDASGNANHFTGQNIVVTGVDSCASLCTATQPVAMVSSSKQIGSGVRPADYGGARFACPTGANAWVARGDCTTPFKYWVGKKLFASFTVGGLAATGNDTVRLGIAPYARNLTLPVGQAGDASVVLSADGNIYYNGGSSASGLGTFANGDEMRLAVDVNTNKVWFGKNNVWAGDPANGTGGFTSIADISGHTVTGLFNRRNSTVHSLHGIWGNNPVPPLNPPSGFVSYTLANSDDPTFPSGTFRGNGQADGPIVFLGFVPDVLVINGNTVTWGVHARRMAFGFKLITASVSWNADASNSYVTSGLPGPVFANANAQIDVAVTARML